jgi:hypothetical protein
MRLISILVVLALLMLPTWIIVSYIISQVLTKGIKGADALSKPSPKMERFRSEHKVLFYLAMFSYPFVVLAASLWMLHELAPSRFDVLVTAFSLSLTIIAVAGGLAVT